MKLILDYGCTLEGAPLKLEREIMAALTMPNPAYLEAVRHKRWTGGLEEELKFYEIKGDLNRLSFPLGFAYEAFQICKKHGLNPEIVDQRRTLPEVDFHFKGQLRDYQQKALDDVLKSSMGVLEARTGSGKTVMALKIIAERKQPTLILVHTLELLNQWRDRIHSFLEIEAGVFSGKSKEIKPITISTVQTAQKNLGHLVPHFGHLIIDECHRTPSTTFSKCVQAFPAKYRSGLSATPFRRDGLGKLIFWTLGPLSHRVDAEALTEIGAVLKPEVISKETDFSYRYNDNYSKMITALSEDESRNRQIVMDVLKEATEGLGINLVLSDRKAHLEKLKEGLSLIDRIDAAVLTGQTPKNERERIVSDLESGKIRVLLSTYQLLSEGFDCSGLSNLFLASPVKYKGKLIQVVGRILRPKDGKTPRIYDYIDAKQPILKAQAKARQKLYKEITK